MFTQLQIDSDRSSHGVTERPWGKFIVLDTVFDQDMMVHKQKLLIVKPNVTMQLHKHVDYTELWIGETTFDYVLENEHGEIVRQTAAPFERVFVPRNRKHGIISTDQEVRIFEVQTGIIVDEDNIKFD